MHREKARRELHKNTMHYIEQIQEATPPLNNSCKATYFPSLKPTKQNEEDMQNTAGESRTNSEVTFSYGLFHMVVPVLADQQELTYNSSVETQGVVWKTCWEWWMVGTDGEREKERERGESRKFLVSAWLDDDYYFTLYEFFIPALATGLSLESFWQQVSPGLQDSFEYSCQCLQFDLWFSTLLTPLKSFWKPFEARQLYNRGITITIMFYILLSSLLTLLFLEPQFGEMLVAQIPMNFMGLILLDGVWWFIHIPFGSTIIFQFLAQIPVDPLSPLGCVWSCTLFALVSYIRLLWN